MLPHQAGSAGLSEDNKCIKSAIIIYCLLNLAKYMDIYLAKRTYFRIFVAKFKLRIDYDNR